MKTRIAFALMTALVALVAPVLAYFAYADTVVQGVQSNGTIASISAVSPTPSVKALVVAPVGPGALPGAGTPITVQQPLPTSTAVYYAKNIALTPVSIGTATANRLTYEISSPASYGGGSSTRIFECNASGTPGAEWLPATHALMHQWDGITQEIRFISTSATPTALGIRAQEK